MPAQGFRDLLFVCLTFLAVIMGRGDEFMRFVRELMQGNDDKKE